MNINSEIILNKIDYKIEFTEIVRVCGMDEKYSKANENLRLLICEAIDIGHKKILPRAIYIIKNVESVDRESGIINLDGGFSLKSKCLLRIIKNPEFLAISVVTCGIDLDNEISRLNSDGKYTLSYILDSVGSVACEDVAEKTQQLIEKDAASSSLFLSLRYSPGYIDFDLKEQAIIFGMLNAKNIGVTLTQSFLMIPRKSISFVLGIGKEQFLDANGYKMCDICGRKDCNYKRR